MASETNDKISLYSATYMYDKTQVTFSKLQHKRYRQTSIETERNIKNQGLYHFAIRIYHYDA